MKTHYLISTALSLALVAGCATESKETQAQLQAEAKVSKEDAQRTALTKAPNGSVEEAELEKEKGKLIWSFDIAVLDSKNITEVNVDAKTGEIVSVEQETPEQQAKEAAEEAKKASKDKD